MTDSDYYQGWGLVMEALQNAYDIKIAKMDPDYPFADTLTELIEDMIDDGVFDFDVNIPVNVTTGFQVGVDSARTEIQRIALEYRRERGIEDFKTIKIEF